MIRQRWPTLGLLTGMTASEGMVGILAPPYLHSLGIELWVIGIVIGLYGWTMLLSRLPVGMLYRPRLARGLLAMALLGMAASSILYPAVDQILPLCAVRLLHGLSYGAGSTVIL